MLIDSHCHLTLEDFQKDLDEVILRAEESGIGKIIVPGLDLQTSQYAIELAERYGSVYAAVGTHPQDSKSYNNNQMDQFEKLMDHEKVVAIGEIGLDYYWDYAPRDTQKQVFMEFLELAKVTKTPVIIHNREAYADLINCVKEKQFENVTGVFHCFSEDEKSAREVLDLGFSVSFTGTITFKNSKTAEISKAVKLSDQLLETDAPFMAPVPYRGKRNEPSFVKEIAQKQAEFRNITVEEVGRITTDHAFRLFPKLKN